MTLYQLKKNDDFQILKVNGCAEDKKSLLSFGYVEGAIGTVISFSAVGVRIFLCGRFLGVSQKIADQTEVKRL